MDLATIEAVITEVERRIAVQPSQAHIARMPLKLLRAWLSGQADLARARRGA